MQAEHISALYEIGDGETYYGAEAIAVEALKANLVTEFENQARDLKERVESLEG